MKLHQARALHTTHDRCVPHPRKDEMIPDIRMDDAIRDLLAACHDQGWRLELNANGTKVLAYPPDKSKPPVPVTARTMGRGLKNIRTALTRAGLVLDTPDLKVVPEVIDLDAAPSEPKKTGTDEQLEAGFKAQVAKHVAETQHIADQMEVPPSIHHILTTFSVLDIGLTETLKTLVDETTRILSTFSHTQHELLKVATTGVTAAISDFQHALDDAQDTALKKQVSDLETEVLSLMDQIDRLNKHIEAEQRNLSKIGSELQAERQARVAAEERAVKSENALNSIKKALS